MGLFNHLSKFAIALLSLLSIAFPLAAADSQSTAPQHTPGTIRLAVDATRVRQKIIHATLKFPVRPGPLTLYYPEWIPGDHAPDNPITDLAGLKFSAGGKTISWRRDLVDMFAFHLDIPGGVDFLDAELDFLLAQPATGFASAASSTAQLDLLSWNDVLLYPKGFPSDQITFAASLKLPSGWRFGTALPIARQAGDDIEFTPVSLTTLVDSPVIAGNFYRAIKLTPGQTPSHEIDIAADSAAALEMPPDMQAEYKQLVAETGKLFSVRHYRDYHFLVTLSDDVAHFGLEHHESSDDRASERSLVDDDLRLQFATLLPHEFVHSWNGKYRRPIGLATPDYNTPMKGDLLWVYEGLTEYLGSILTARSGLYLPGEWREELAYIAATFDNRVGRTWRPLQDTADAAQLLYFAYPPWEDYRRSTDYYDEGLLIWLDVDVTIRQLTNGQKSMNDFCRLFHGGTGGEPALKTYNFEDVVATLNSIAPYDWTKFLRTRLDSVSPHAPLGGIENGGWKLVYNEMPNRLIDNKEDAKRLLDETFSIGMVIDSDGSVRDVLYGGPAFNAGVGPLMRVTAVNGQQFSPDVLDDAIQKSTSSHDPLFLLMANGNYFETMNIDYHGGLRNPHLERVNQQPDLLGEIIRPLAPVSGSIPDETTSAAK
jgi:predicted metalloprotease with PDZ domain